MKREPTIFGGYQDAGFRLTAPVENGFEKAANLCVQSLPLGEADLFANLGKRQPDLNYSLRRNKDRSFLKLQSQRHLGSLIILFLLRLGAATQ
jgi:hypothetical protein